MLATSAGGGWQERDVCYLCDCWVTGHVWQRKHLVPQVDLQSSPLLLLALHLFNLYTRMHICRLCARALSLSLARSLSLSLARARALSLSVALSLSLSVALACSLSLALSLSPPPTPSRR